MAPTSNGDYDASKDPNGAFVAAVNKTYNDNASATPERDYTIGGCFERAKQEIVADIRAGHFSAFDIHSFSDLHNHVDANAYGGLTDDEFQRTDWVSFANTLHSKLHAWIVDDGIMRELDKRLTKEI